MAAAPKIAEATYRGRYPSIFTEIVYGLCLRLGAGLLWKMHHWSEQKKVKEFYDLLDKGYISLVVEDE